MKEIISRLDAAVKAWRDDITPKPVVQAVRKPKAKAVRKSITETKAKQKLAAKAKRTTFKKKYSAAKKVLVATPAPVAAAPQETLQDVTKSASYLELQDALSLLSQANQPTVTDTDKVYDVAPPPPPSNIPQANPPVTPQDSWSSRYDNF